MFKFNFRQFFSTPFILLGSILLSTGLLIRVGARETNRIYDGIAKEIRNGR